MDRQDFVAGSMAAAAASLQWLRAVGALGATSAPQTTRITASAGAASGAIVFGAIVHAMLPFEDARFSAIAPSGVQRRAQALFKLDVESAMQNGLVMFDDLRQFQTPPSELLVSESAYFPIDDAERWLANPFAARQARDVKSFTLFYQKLQPRVAFFHELRLADARAYCMLWAHSALGLRRRFYQSVKSLVMAATYSMDETWRIIDYAGPLLHFRSV